MTKVIIFLGRSGCGKDTQAKFLQEQHGFSVIKTGDLFRSLAAEPTFTGKKIARILEEGGLPPSWLAEYLWTRNLITAPDFPGRIIFNGAPRRLHEAQELDDVLGWFERADTGAFLLDISREEARARLLKRGRTDDDERAIAERLDWFEEIVMPVVEYYEKSGRLVRINGEQSIEKVFEEILSKIGA